MPRTQVQDLLELLGDKERRRVLKSLAQNPHHSPALRATCKWLIDHLPEILHADDLLPRLTATGRKPEYLKNLLSDLTEQLRAYLVEQEEIRNPVRKQLLLLEGMLRRNAPMNVFLREWRKTERRLHKASAASIRGLQHRTQLMRLLYEAQSVLQHRKRGQSKHSDLPPIPLRTAIEALDRHYLVQRGHWQLEWHSRQKITPDGSAAPGILDFDAVIKEAEWPEVEPVLGPLIAGNYRLLQSGEGYWQLKARLLATPPAPNEHLNYCQYLQNHCIIEMNRGQRPTFLPEYLFWVDHRAQANILLHQDQISHAELKNYITCCLLLAPPDTARAHTFLRRFGPHLEPTYRAEATAFNQAIIHYYETDYSRALRLLRTASFADPFTKADVRMLELRILYDNEDWTALELALKNAKQYFKRTTGKSAFNPRKLQSINASLRFLDQIHRTPASKPHKLASIAQNLAAARSVVNRNWLTAKLKEKLRAI